MVLSLYSQHPPSNIQNFHLHASHCCPGLTQEMLDYEIHVIGEFVKSTQNA